VVSFSQETIDHPHTQLLMTPCIIETNAALMNAKSELEKAYAASRKQTFMPTPGRAPEYLEQAKDLLDKACG
jgi:hypothetical protein